MVRSMENQKNSRFTGMLDGKPHRYLEYILKHWFDLKFGV